MGFLQAIGQDLVKRTMATSLTIFLAVSFGHDGLAQESSRDLKDTAQTSKYLTHGEIDTWLFDGQKNETLIVFVESQQFDPVIGLAKVDEDSETILFSVDDEGNKSRFSFRLKEKGEYKIRIHGFEMKGSGNYSMEVQRFVGKPVKMNKKVAGNLNGKGNTSFFFTPKRGTNLVVDTNNRWQVHSPSGTPIAPDWQSNVWLTQDAEYLVVLSGNAGQPFELTLKPAKVTTLEMNDENNAAMEGNSLRLWQIDGKKGQFRLITVTRAEDFQSRLVLAPKLVANGKTLGDSRSSDGFTALPVGRKGTLTQYAVVFNRDARYQLQGFSTAENEIVVRISDPTRSASRGESNADKLPIGGTHFYGFEAKAGDLIQASCSSDSFDTLLQLHDRRGQKVVANDDGSKAETNSRLTHMINTNGYFRWHISSVGNGGGGEYNLRFDSLKLNEIKVGETVRGDISGNQTQYWELHLKKGAKLFFDVRSEQVNPKIVLYGPDGLVVDSDEDSGISTNALMAVKIMKKGRYSLWVSAKYGSGEYEIRVIDAK